MTFSKQKDGFGYDLDKALKEGNVFERIFHRLRISPWLNKIDYSSKKVLDVGCNTGILLIPLLEKGVDVVGVDISEGDITKARKNLKEKGFSLSRAKIADAKKLSFDSNSFDMVLLSDILEHVDKPELIAKEALRVLKTGGVILVTVPNEWHPFVKFSWIRRVLSGRDNANIEDHPDVPYNLKKLTMLFPGTEIIETRYMSFWVQIFCKFKKL